MKVGKVPNDILKKIVLDKIMRTRPEVLVKPGIGEDCSILDFEDNVCVLSSDPITGAAKDVGRLAVHISCNDIASAGIEPIGIMVTILAPADATIEQLDAVMGQVLETSAAIRVSVLGGHTEITTAVNRFVIVTTAVGKGGKNRMVTTAGAKPGDFIIMTKSCGMEGTAIIANDMEIQLAGYLSCEELVEAKSYVDFVSVVKEGILAGEFGVNSMHDATEGGILGAVWEVAEAAGLGFELFKEKIPVSEVTSKICKFYDIDPFKLISSGSMIITCQNGEELVKMLGCNDVMATVIGKITTDSARVLIKENNRCQVEQPDVDELYKVVK